MDRLCHFPHRLRISLLGHLRCSVLLLLLLYRGLPCCSFLGRSCVFRLLPVRVHLHRHRTIHRRVRAQCCCRGFGKPSDHLYPGWILWCCGALWTNYRVLEILVSAAFAIDLRWNYDFLTWDG